VQVLAKAGDAGPVGGIFRSFGRPTQAGDGTVAFRASFERGSGGIPGFYTADGTQISPYLGVGDPAPGVIGGRFVSFNQRISLNDADSLAFIASVGGGNISNGVFLAAPTTLTVKRFRLKTGTSSKPDRLTMKLVLDAGALGTEIDPSTSRVVLTLRDTASAAWSVTADPGEFRKRGRSFTFKQKPVVKRVKLRVTRGGVVKATIKARPEITSGGVFPIVPPISVDFELGDVSAQGTANCIIGKRRTRCR
jgi:hypothetical protein